MFVQHNMHELAFVMQQISISQTKCSSQRWVKTIYAINLKTQEKIIVVITMCKIHTTCMNLLSLSNKTTFN